MSAISKCRTCSSRDALLPYSGIVVAMRFTRGAHREREHERLARRGEDVEGRQLPVARAVENLREGGG
eukprot:6172313-Pleurochrysis_carterae.AAC.5